MLRLFIRASCSVLYSAYKTRDLHKQREAKLDPITDIFRTLHVTAIGLHRFEATAPWGLIQEKQTEEEITSSKEGLAHRLGAFRHAVAR